MSPTKVELAGELKVDELKALAAEHGVDLEDAHTKDEIIEKLTASRKVTKAVLESASGDDEGTREEAIAAKKEEIAAKKEEIAAEGEPSREASVELLPIIPIHSWVRFKTTTEVPARLRGQDGVVLSAPVEYVHPKRGPAFDKQSRDTMFSVRIRETGEEVEVRRSAFAAVATSRGSLSSLVAA